MVKLAANLSMMFSEVGFTDRFSAASKAGFKGVEYLFPYEYDKEELIYRLGDNELVQVLHNLPAGNWDAGDRGIACDPRRVEEFREGVELATEYASALNCPQVNCLAGIKPQALSKEEAHQVLVSYLKFAAPILGNVGVKLIIESINTIDIPGFFLNGTKQALGVLKEVGSNNLSLQYDIYHMQIMEGDLARTIENNIDSISHMQLADNPGRHEPGTGEINYPFLFDFIDGLNYAGGIGCEYVPDSDTLGGLSWAKDYL